MRTAHLEAPSIAQAADFQGERRLLAALIVDAFDCYKRTVAAKRPSDRTLHEETKEWIFSEERSSLSFVSICDALGFDAAQLRRHLLGRRFA